MAASDLPPKHSFEGSSRTQRSSFGKLVLLAVGAILAACDGDSPTAAPPPPNADVVVEDPTGAVTIQPPLYLGATGGQVDGQVPVNDGIIQYEAVRVADGARIAGDRLASFPTARTVTSQMPGDYRTELVYYGNGNARTVLATSAAVTLPASGSVTLPSMDYGNVLGAAGGTLRVNGQAVTAAQYKICALTPPMRTVPLGDFCRPVGNGGSFRLWSVAGAGSFEVRSTTNALLGTFPFTAAAGQTTSLGDVDAVDPTGTVTIQPPLYLGATGGQVDGQVPVNDGIIQYEAVRVADGLRIAGDRLASFPSARTVTSQIPGDYRTELVYYGNGNVRTVLATSGAVTLPTSGSVTLPSFEYGSVLGAVGGTLRVNGQAVAAGQYRICALTPPMRTVPLGDFCRPAGSGGSFRLWSVAGAGSFEVRSTTNALLGTFPFTAAAGQTTSLGDIDAVDPTGTVTIQPPLYLGATGGLVDGHLPVNGGVIQYEAVRVADGVRIAGDRLTSFPTARTVSSQVPGSYRTELVYYGNGNVRTVLASSAPVTLSASGSVTLPSMDYANVLGAAGGTLRVNGQPASPGQYKICALTPPMRTVPLGDFCGSVGTGGDFRVWTVAGDGSFEVRTTTNVLLGAFTYRAAAGQVTLIGQLTNATPGETPPGSDVTVQPVNTGGSTTNTSTSLSFSNVTSGGTTTVTQTSQGAPAPSGYKLGNPPIYYDITTTASFSGPITLCINYTGTSFPNASNLRLMHGDGAGGWTDITTSHDLTTRIICGLTNSLSPFAVMEGPANRNPVAVPGGGYAGVEGTAVQFDGSASSDPDGDVLSYSWSFGDGATGTGATPSHAYQDDGQFTATLTVHDGKGGSHSRSVAVVIGNAAPILGAVTVPNTPVPIGSVISVSAAFTDAGAADTHSGHVQWDLDTPFGGATIDAGTVRGSFTAIAAGVYTITLRVTDDEGAVSQRTASSTVVVYDPSGPFVTGGGWITSPAGACAPTTCGSAGQGRVTFSFVTRYQRGASTPSGNLELDFNAGGLRFASTRFDWLAVGGPLAQLGGEGTVNGVGGYQFLVTLVDGDANPGKGPDEFRIKIWNASGVVYDNQAGQGEDSSAATVLGGGSIVIHR